MSTRSTRHILTLSCPDQVGIVAAVTQALAAHGGLIVDAQHYREPISNSSLLRLEFSPGAEHGLDMDALRREFAVVAGRLGMTWEITDTRIPMRVLVAVSKQGHCLNSLLHRWASGTLPIEIVGVVSNHETQRRLVEWHGLPFHYLPIEGGRKEDQEEKLLGLFSELKADLLVLARYMQILTERACRKLAGRAINIHHSFLPGFKGAKPYHQAHERGVKLIGATAHYVTGDLDEGPIIEQAVERVDHNMGVEQLTTLGNEIEAVVLNRAVQWHAERRVFAFGNRTVVLR
ncbi:MAG TPA: formyltetrahydrofolate deformylase [Steroidobacter sp.]|uniref:formyltetrahydrofolate deformylase n=1 Tax=Steroidobacter sp. TaxID=1978227 RepID=UPI002ED866C2